MRLFQKVLAIVLIAVMVLGGLGNSQTQAAETSAMEVSVKYVNNKTGIKVSFKKTDGAEAYAICIKGYGDSYLKYLTDNGFNLEAVQPVDMFPQTKHVETVVLLSKGEVDSKKIRVEFSLEDMDMSEFQDGATYTQIKDYVLEHSGLKVSNLYISQIKRKCGIEVGKNYNLPKSEDSRQPLCPPEKEKAIREAFKYFGII